MQAPCQITDVTNAADRLRAVLQEHEDRTGISPTKAAESAGIKQSTLSMALARGSLPKRLNALAAVLGVRPEWIENGDLPKEAGAPAQAPKPGKDDLASAHAELIGYFDVLSPYEQVAILKDVRSRAARALGDRLLAERFGVKGYANDDSLPDIYKKFERRRERRATEPQAVPPPFNLHGDRDEGQQDEEAGS